MQNRNTLWRVFSSIVVFAVSLTAGQPQQYNCPGCIRCTPEHRTLNGTLMVLVNALCKFRRGVKFTSIPQSLPSNLGTLMVTSHSIHELKAASLQKYTYLYRLYLDKNALHTIENGSFTRQQFLNQLDLSENNLGKISAGTFQGLKTLQHLQLDHNQLQKISRGTFSSVPAIKYLDLQANKISVLEEGAFDRLDHLETLLLSFNKLRAINSGVLGNLMSLRQVKLASNQIQTIDADAFDCAPLIDNLVLKENKLDRIPKEAIGHLRFLEVFNISENPVEFIENDALIGLESVTTINLSDCNISSIQNGSFDNLTKIAIVHLYNNPLKCDCHLSWLPRWLSRRPQVTFIGAVCRAPSDISGNNLTAANLSSFVCSCATCKKDAACSLVPTNCSCSENWAGSSCIETCQSNDDSVNACRDFGGKCYCDRNATLTVQQKRRVFNCSFNITSEKCSEYGEIKKFGSHLECVCKQGFDGNGTHCVDIDECKTGTAVCSKHADCVNTPGSYDCKCHEGFEEEIPPTIPELMCKDIDECTERKPCHVHAECHNSPGSYTCTCRTGYAGDGVTCLPVPDQPTDVTVTAVNPTEVSVTWTLVNTSIIREVRVEYKGFGIHGSEWLVIKLQPHETKTNLKDLKPDSTYLVRVGAFSIYNTSSYSKETHFETSPIKNPSATDSTAGGDSQNTVVIAVALVVSIVMLVIIGITLHCLMRRKKKRKKSSNPPYVPGLEDLIEMRTRTHSGGADSRGNRDLLELGSTLHSFTSCAVDYTDEWEIPRDHLEIGQKIGEGQFGLVLEGTLITDDGPIKVAVKTIKEHADRFDYKDLLQEMEMMKEIGQHPHVVSLVGTCTTPGPLYIITEYVSGGNLLDYLRASRPDDETYVNIISTLSSRDLLKISLDCARGMNHIAEKKFVHRDLAARNILLTEEYEAKVADFGLARDIYGDGQYVKTGGGRVPIKWMAPESIQDQIYTTRSDVWSFGVLLWEIITIGGSPYPCVPVNLLLTKLLCGYRMSKPAHCSDELYDLMKSCWQLDPKERPSFSEICCTLSEMLSESARSYVNITVSEERVGPEEEFIDDAHEQTTSV